MGLWALYVEEWDSITMYECLMNWTKELTLEWYARNHFKHSKTYHLELHK